MRAPLLLVLGVSLLGGLGFAASTGADEVPGDVSGDMPGGVVDAEGGTDAERAVTLHVRPDTCVAMRRGNVCYQNVELSWQGAGPGAFCLHRAKADETLICWRDAASGSHVHRYVSTASERYELRREGEATALSSVTVDTAWVYRDRRRVLSGWRLF